MIWRQCYVLKNLVPPLGAYLPQKILIIPLWFLKVVIFSSKFAFWLIWWCWIHFWCYSESKKICDPLGGILTPKCSTPLWQLFLKVVRFDWKFALWVIWWCWIHFWCYFDPKKFLWPPRVFFYPKPPPLLEKNWPAPPLANFPKIASPPSSQGGAESMYVV